VASRPGEGATFSFTCLAQLPAADTAEDRAASLQTRIYTSQLPEEPAEHVVVPPDNATHTPSPPPDSADILVVDDNPVNVFVLETQLRRLGFGCGVAHDGVEATEYVRTSLGLATAPEPSPSVLSVPDVPSLPVPRVIFMDLNMPRMGGLQASRVIRRLEQQARDETGYAGHIRIVALSASDSSSVLSEDLREAGLDLFLCKPITLDHLRGALVEA
jgi:CheY-like chemotaxis protein